MASIPGKHQILVVSDEIELLDSHREDFEAAGLAFLVASSGPAALEALSAERIDLALVDLETPEIAGTELLKTVKECYPRTAVLSMGEDDGADAAVSQIKSGAIDYLVKPVTMARLIDAVNEALEKQTECLDYLDQQQHLEELLVNQSRALDNKIREVKALSGMFAELVVAKAKPGVTGEAKADDTSIFKPRSGKVKTV